jgi:transcriptional regulator of arginine metabolism
MLPGGASGKESSTQSGANYLADGFLSIDFSLNMVVIKTKPAYASSIAAIIDSANPYEFLGTIAGDDTIFMVMREGVERSDVFTFLENVMPNLKGRLI